ncbi:hypothetical protein ABK040_014313 [Willaertia magna]
MDFIIQYLLSLYTNNNLDCQSHFPIVNGNNVDPKGFVQNIVNNNIQKFQGQQHNYSTIDHYNNFQPSPVFNFNNNFNLNKEQQTYSQQQLVLYRKNDIKNEAQENKELYRDNHVIVREQSIDSNLESSVIDSYYKTTINQGYNNTTVNDKNSNENQSTNITINSPRKSKLTSSVIESINNDQLKDMKTRNLLKRKNVTTPESNSSFKNFILSTPTDISKKIQEHEALLGKRRRGRPKTKTTTNNNNKKIKH